MTENNGLTNTLEFISKAYKEMQEENERLKTEAADLREKVEKLKKENSYMLKAIEEGLEALTTAQMREEICKVLLGLDTMRIVAIAAERMKGK